MPNRSKKGTQKTKQNRSSAPSQSQPSLQSPQPSHLLPQAPLHPLHKSWRHAPPSAVKNLRGLAEHLATKFGNSVINGDIDLDQIANTYLDTQFDLRVLERLEPSDLDEAMKSAEFIELVHVFRQYFQDMNRMGCNWPLQGAVRLATAQWFSSRVNGRGTEKSPHEMQQVIYDIKTSYLHLKMDSWNNLLLSKANAMVSELRDMQKEMEQSLEKLSQMFPEGDQSLPAPPQKTTSRESPQSVEKVDGRAVLAQAEEYIP